MFYDLSRRGKRIAAIIIFLLAWAIFSGVLIAIKSITAELNAAVILQCIIKFWYLKILIGLLAVWLLVYLDNGSLDIQAKRVGHGQHGSSRWLTDAEKKDRYTFETPPESLSPGFFVGLEGDKMITDCTDRNVLLISPPGGGKTTKIIIPSIYHNARINRNGGIAPSMLCTDLKGTLWRSSGFLSEFGYTRAKLDFRNISDGLYFNIMYRVNDAMDHYLASTDAGERAAWYGAAERYAKIIASCTVDNLEQAVKSSGGDYFDETAKGLITGVILLVSEYGFGPDRHIISVFNIIIALLDSQTSNKQTNLLLSQIPQERIKYYTASALSADMRTLMNVFSSALSKLTKFIDAELEQAITRHSPEINVNSFVEKPTAIFIVVPDENSTRHFFASLFIRFWCNDLIEIAETKYAGTLPRQVQIYADEFGNMPAINDIDVLMSAVRSRNIRMLISIQSYAQLEKYYSAAKAKIIKDCCQIMITSFVAPSSLATAKDISEMLGNETVQTGSVSKNGNVISSTSSMVGRPLAAPSDLMQLPNGTWIIMSGGMQPCKMETKGYYEYLHDITMDKTPPSLFITDYYEIPILTSEEILRNVRYRQALADGLID